MPEVAAHPNASDQVKGALLNGFYAACDGLAAVSWFRFQPDARRGQYRNLTIRAGDREVQVGISPTGRAIRIFVDGKEVS